MSKRLLLLLLFLSVLMSGCGGGNGGGSTLYASIMGYVAESGTLTRLNNVKVEIGGKITNTDENGFFRVDNLPAGVHRFSFSKTNYYTYSFSIQLPAGVWQFNEDILIVKEGDLSDLGPAYIQDVTDGNNEIIINAQKKVSTVIAIAYNHSSSTINPTISISDDSGSSLIAPLSGFANHPLTLQIEKNDLMELLRKHEREVSQNLLSKGIKPGQSQKSLKNQTDFYLTNEKFWKYNFDSQDSFSNVSATLKYTGSNCLIYLDNSQSISQTHINELGALFDNQIYANETSYFCNVDMDVDGEQRIYILLSPLPGSILGYFTDINEWSDYQYSNEKEMIYVTTSNYYSNPSNWVNSTKGVIAHEFQHLINYTNKPQPNKMEIWLNEGLSMVAMDIALEGPNGHYRPTVDNWIKSYLSNTNRVSLCNWDDHYGGVYLFMRYFADRFGVDKLKNLYSTTGSSQDMIMSSSGSELLFEEIFKDWLTTVILECLNIPITDPQYDKYQYKSALNLSESQFIGNFYLYPPGSYPVSDTAGIYVVKSNLENATNITVEVNGSPDVKLRVISVPKTGATLPFMSSVNSPPTITKVR